MQKTAAGWNVWRGILGRGRRGEESDTGRYKIGDGISTWAALNYQGEGSGLVRNGPFYTLEYNAGTFSIVDGGEDSIPFDTLSPEISAVGDGSFTVPDGVYKMYYDLEFVQPAEDRSARFSVSGGNAPDLDFSVNPIRLLSTGNWRGFMINGQGEISATGMAGEFRMMISAYSDAGGGAPLVLSYAFVKLTKIS